MKTEVGQENKNTQTDRHDEHFLDDARALFIGRIFFCVLVSVEF